MPPTGFLRGTRYCSHRLFFVELLGPDGQIFVDGFVTELGRKIITAALLDQLRDFGFGVGKIAEVACAGRTGFDASGLAIFRCQRIVVDAVHA